MYMKRNFITTFLIACLIQMPYALALECKHHPVRYYFKKDGKGELLFISVKTSLLPEAITQSAYEKERITEDCPVSVFSDDFDWSKAPCKEPEDGGVYAVPDYFKIRFLIDGDSFTRNCSVSDAYDFITGVGGCTTENFVICEQKYEKDIPEWCDSCGYTHTRCNKQENGLCILNDLKDSQIERGSTKYNCSDILGVEPEQIRRVKSEANKLSDCVLAGTDAHVYEDNAGRYTFDSSECSELYCTDLTSDLCTSV